MLKFGVIGTSWITESFIESAQSTGNWKLAAVYSRTDTQAKQFAQKYSVSTTYTSIDSLCSDADIDAVYIASPNSLHFEQARSVLAAGKHAIVEKPVTSNLREFDQLYTFAKTAPHGAKLIEAYRHIQERNFKILKQSLPKVGRILGANFVFAQYSSRFNAVLKGETPTIFSPQYSGGCLVDMGVYPLCFALSLFGKPLRQRYNAIMLHCGTDGGGSVVLEYESFTVTLITSKCYVSTAPSEIFGELGTLATNGVTDIESIKLSTVADKKTVELAKVKEKLNLKEEAQEFYRLITEDDTEGLEQLENLSRMVVEVTQDLRRQNGIEYPADQ